MGHFSLVRPRNSSGHFTFPVVPGPGLRRPRVATCCVHLSRFSVDGDGTAHGQKGVGDGGMDGKVGWYGGEDTDRRVQAALRGGRCGEHVGQDRARIRCRPGERPCHC